jgi:selenocysteine-specific translation elongation factor
MSNETTVGFYMTIDDVFSVTGKGIIATGQIKNGSIKKGDNVEVFKDSTTLYHVKIKGIEVFRQMLEIANQGDFVGLILEGIDDKYKLQKGMTITNVTENERMMLEKQRIENLTHNQTSILTQLDKNSDGEVDLVENDFNKLIAKHQKQILQIDKNYIHQFIKISNFIKTKKQNTQKIFESIKDTSSQEELIERVNLLKNQIHAYELLVFHSINMIGALVSEDLITFYEIYESFDKLGMFNSNWENEVSEKLTNIGDKLDDLMHSIYNMEQNIVSELSHLSYVTQESFEDLNRSVTSQLREVESSINTNNLMTAIQTYQMYKINKNTKGIR